MAELIEPAFAREMRALAAGELVDLWELGRARHPIDRALLLLARACPDLGPGDLCALTVGQRNGRLLALRQRTFGPVAECFARCPQCGAALEFAADIPALFQPEPAAREFELSVEGFALAARLPNSLDLAAIARAGDVDQGRLVLVERCVLRAERDGQPARAADLPEPVLLALAAALDEADPQATLPYALVCPDCEHGWTVLFDIAAFFWSEIEAQARRLVRDVHVLAQAYGWREADILALSSARRQLYLDLVSDG